MVSTKGLGILNFVNEIMGRYQYDDVLESIMLSKTGEWFSDGNDAFMDDKVPCNEVCCLNYFLQIVLKFSRYLEICPTSSDGERLEFMENNECLTSTAI